MAARSIRSLPTAGNRVAHPPTKSPMIIEEFAQVWLKNLMETGYAEYEVAIPEAGSFRASWASKRCDRSLQYAMAGAPESNPPSVADYWRMHIGTLIHGDVNEACRTLGNGWIPDINIDLRPIGIAGSAHADLVRFVDEYDDAYEFVGVENDEMIYATGKHEVLLRVGEWHPETMVPTHVAEIKSVGGYAFKMAATTQGGPQEGPRYGATMQGAYAAAALGVDKLLVINLSLENVSPKLAAAYSTSEVGRFAAEWKYLISDLQADIDSDVARIARIDRANEAGVLVARELHDPEVAEGATVTTPQTGAWVVQVHDDVHQTGSTWMCAYCSHRDRCIADGAATETEVSL